jgi:prepilin-type N-terminal cleavage/methylation domain-containing protein
MIYKRGFSLIEILLTLSIVMILFSSALMYWQSVQQTKLTEQGYELLQDIVEAAQGWQPKYLDKGKYSGISANALLQEGSIPEQYITNFDEKSLNPTLPVLGNRIKITLNTGLTTPWGGKSQVSVSQAKGDKKGMLEIVFSNIPNYACLQLATRINSGSAMEHGNADIQEGSAVFDSAVCQIRERKVMDKLLGSKLTVWYHPDF